MEVDPPLLPDAIQTLLLCVRAFPTCELPKRVICMYLACTA